MTTNDLRAAAAEMRTFDSDPLWPEFADLLDRIADDPGCSRDTLAAARVIVRRVDEGVNL